MLLTHAGAKTLQYKLNRFATWEISFRFFSIKFFCSFFYLFGVNSVVIRSRVQFSSVICCFARWIMQLRYRTISLTISPGSTERTRKFFNRDDPWLNSFKHCKEKTARKLSNTESRKKTIKKNNKRRKNKQRTESKKRTENE